MNEHVFVLMLENRSFDHMLGFAGLTGIDAVTGKRTTAIDLTHTQSLLATARALDRKSVLAMAASRGLGTPVKVLDLMLKMHSNVADGKLIMAEIPADFAADEDPGHEFENVLVQLCGYDHPYPTPPGWPVGGGFVTTLPTRLGGPYPPIKNNGFATLYKKAMKCYAHEKPPHEQLPVLLQLAREFAVCDRWFSSIPGPTWPNRFFMHAASSAGIDASPSGFDSAMAELFNGYSFHNGTIFHRLESHQLKWAVFQGDSFPVTGALAGLNDDYFFGFDKFEAAVNNPEYPFAYTFIEPNYGNDLPLSPRISLAETRNIRKMMSRGARSSLNRSTRLSEILPNGPRVYYLSPTMSMADSSMFHHLQPGDGLYYGDFGTSLSGDRLYLLVGKHGFDFTQLGP